jgi:hypothetical protein
MKFTLQNFSDRQSSLILLLETRTSAKCVSSCEEEERIRVKNSLEDEAYGIRLSNNEARAK